MEYVFTIHDGTKQREVRQKELDDYAIMFGLDRIAKDRYSSLFVVNLMLLESINGVDPLQVIDEIKALEGLGPSLQTKQETEFKGTHLKGLWHKHFLPALPSVLAHNITNHLGKNGTQKLVEKVFDPSKSPVVTHDMIKELAHNLVVGSIEERAAKDKLTGEWIVYAKENNANYYLGIWRHDAGDEKIAETIKSTCVPQFPFLAKYFS